MALKDAKGKSLEKRGEMPPQNARNISNGEMQGNPKSKIKGSGLCPDI